MKADDGRRSIDGQLLTGDGSALNKLTLMDLITDHNAKAAALPPGAHMTRRSMQLDLPKDIQARRMASGEAAHAICLSYATHWPTASPAAWPALLKTVGELAQSVKLGTWRPSGSPYALYLCCRQSSVLCGCRLVAVAQHGSLLVVPAQYVAVCSCPAQRFSRQTDWHLLLTWIHCSSMHHAVMSCT
jgi:hypothetical protein